jgi:peroxidase
MKIVDGQKQSTEYVHLHKMLFNPYSLYARGGADRAMRGAMQTDMQKVDPFFTPEVKILHLTHFFD